MIARLLLVVALCCAALPAAAVIETYQFSSPELEQRYQQLSAELRCPKCQNQNIADSNAPIAQDLRRLLHQQLEAGETDEEILDYMVARYGEFVRYRPKFSGATAILWFAPLLLLVIGLVVLLRTLRTQRGAPSEADAHLGAADREQLDALLGRSERDS